MTRTKKRVTVADLDASLSILHDAMIALQRDAKNDSDSTNGRLVSMNGAMDLLRLNEYSIEKLDDYSVEYRTRINGAEQRLCELEALVRGYEEFDYVNFETTLGGHGGLLARMAALEAQIVTLTTPKPSWWARLRASLRGQA